MQAAVSIESLNLLVQRAERLIERGSDLLIPFWDRTKMAVVRPSTMSVSVTNTCFTALALIQSDSLYSAFSQRLTKPDEPPTNPFLCETLLAVSNAEWKSHGLKDEHNRFTTPIVVATLLSLINHDTRLFLVGLNPNDVALKDLLKNRVVVSKMITGIENVHSFALSGQTTYEFRDPDRDTWEKYDRPSAYLTYWCYRSIEETCKFREKFPQSSILKGLAQDGKVQVGELDGLLGKIGRWAELEIHSQIAYHTANDFAAFDASHLMYAVSIWATDSSRTATPLDTRLAVTALHLIFDVQNPNGLWPKSYPIFHCAEFGSAYPFAFESLTVLLDALIGSASIFEPHLGRLEKSLEWAEQNETIVPQRGWRSNHLIVQRTHDEDLIAWSTASVVMFSRSLRHIAATCLNDRVLTSFSAKRFPRIPQDLKGRDAFIRSLWTPDKFYDADLPDPGIDPTESPLSLQETLNRVIIRPHLDESLYQSRRYSAVLFGPPGTAKTTIAEKIAQSLGWPYVYLQTSDFSSDGAGRVTGHARSVFQKLGMLERAVVLFDEVEEFVRARVDEKNGPVGSADSRMITTSMLSLIQEVRKRARIIFFVATNFFGAFDLAITRAGGRFDLLILVGPPNKLAKHQLLKVRFAKASLVPDKFQVQALTAFSRLLDAKYEDCFQYFTYSEWIDCVEAWIRTAKQQQKAGRNSGASLYTAAEQIATVKLGAIALSKKPDQAEFILAAGRVRIA